MGSLFIGNSPSTYEDDKGAISGSGAGRFLFPDIYAFDLLLLPSLKALV